MKTILQVVIIFSFISVQAQYTLEEDYAGTPISNGETVTAYYNTDDSNPEAEIDVNVISQNTNDFRFQILSTDQGVNAENWFCTNLGLCYPPHITDWEIELFADQTRQLQLHYKPNGEGDATVNYRISEVGNSSNSILFSVHYIGTSTSVEEKLTSNISIKAFPNPANQFCKIAYDVKEDSEIYLYNIIGERIESYHINTGSGSINIDTSNLKNGTYIYQGVCKSNVITSNYLIVNH